MTMSLFQAMNTGTARTYNGAVTNATSFNACLDLFNTIGSSRGRDVTAQFDRALAENPEVALRMVQWVRDCRGGAGERELFRQILRNLNTKPAYKEAAIAILKKVPTLGYWKDLIKLYDVTDFRPTINEMITFGLASEDGLCAKYMPRKGKEASKIAAALGLTQKQWRKLVVSMSNTVEQKMCAKKWDDIDFGKLPSLASARYQKAFMKNAEARYNEYIAALEKGEAKINAGAVYPYDVLKSSRTGNDAVATQQWKAMPNYMEGTDERVLPLIDVSGSMCTGTAIAGLSAMDVAISLGMYLSERQDGKFKNHFMTFSDRPRMEIIRDGMLSHRFRQVQGADWGGSTNIQNAFTTLLNSATQYKVPADEMPTTVVILSDMEFNCSWVNGRSESAFRMIDAEYAKHGYSRPKLVFWNLAGRAGNVPVTQGEGGTAMVSGFSPAIMTSVLGAKDFNPNAIMLEALMVERYDI